MNTNCPTSHIPAASYGNSLFVPGVRSRGDEQGLDGVQHRCDERTGVSMEYESTSFIYPSRHPFIGHDCPRGLTVHGTAVVNDFDDCFTWLSSPNCDRTVILFQEQRKWRGQLGLGEGNREKPPGFPVP